MKIKNLNAFLAAAVLTTSAVTVHAHEANQHNQYNQYRGDLGQMGTFRSTNIKGEIVKMVPSDRFNENEMSLARPDNLGHFSLLGQYMGSRACTVFLDNQALSNPSLSSTSNLFSLVDRQAYLYAIVAHEVSHCTGITPEDSERFVTRTMSKYRDLRPYEPQLQSMASSIRESYADLNAVLLGASKTGDWSVMANYLIPERTQNFNSRQSSLLAVIDMTDSIDPRKLKGMSYSQIVQMTKVLVQMHFNGQDGELDITSTGAKNIMKSWYAMGLESKTYIKAYGKSAPSSTQAQEWIELHRQFGELVMGKNALKDRESIALLFGLKQYSLERQNNLINTLGLATDPQGARLQQMNSVRIQNLDQIYSLSNSIHYGRQASVTDSKNSFGQWIRTGSNPNGSQELAKALPQVMSEALMPGANEQMNSQIDRAQTSIRQQLAKALTAPSINPNQYAKTEVQSSQERTHRYVNEASYPRY